jgi:hypothetical protein
VHHGDRNTIAMIVTLSARDPARSFAIAGVVVASLLACWSGQAFGAETHPYWKCGRNYIEGTGSYGGIRYPNGHTEDIWLNNSPPMGSPTEEKISACVGTSNSNARYNACNRKFNWRRLQWIQWKGDHCDADGSCDKGTLYYRGKACKAVERER